MADCIDIIERNDIKFGLIYGVKGQLGKPILKATNNIPKDVVQWVS